MFKPKRIFHGVMVRILNSEGRHYGSRLRFPVPSLMIVSFLRLILGLYKCGYLLIFNVCHFDYTAFAASERTGSRKPVKSHQLISCHLKCTQTDRPKSTRNRCVY